MAREGEVPEKADRMFLHILSQTVLVHPFHHHLLGFGFRGLACRFSGVGGRRVVRGRCTRLKPRLKPTEAPTEPDNPP